MKLTSSNRLVIAILIVVALAVAFWLLLLSPKREEATKLGTQVEQLQATLALSESAVAEAEAAKQQFSKNYEQLVVLGEAVPANDETSSLLVELNKVANQTGVTFESIQLGSADGSEATETSTESAPAEPESTTEEGATGVPAAAVAPTEAAAALQPLGASVGPAGLSILPYDLEFSGTFFDIADFIKEIDSMVKPKTDDVAVDGRLITIDGFAMNSSDPESGTGLEATFSVTTYLVPAGQGITAGATEAAPEEASPEAAPEEEAPESSTTSAR